MLAQRTHNTLALLLFALVRCLTKSNGVLGNKRLMIFQVLVSTETGKRENKIKW